MSGFEDIYKTKKKGNKKNNFSQEQVINQAIQFHLEGNIEKAKNNYQQLINQGCNDYRVFSNYGVILRGLGKLEEAELSYRKAIEIKPDFPQAHSNLGALFNDLGKLEEAELSYRKAIEIKPDYAEAHSNLAGLLNDQGKLKEAELSYRKAIEIRPDYVKAHSNLGSILNVLGKLKEAELSCRKAIEIKPDYAEGHLNMGVLLNNLGKFQDAEISFRKAIEIKPNYAKAHSNLGSLLNDLGRLQDAELSCRKAIEINPDYAEGYLNLGALLKDLDKLQEAELSYRKAIEIKPDFAEAYSNLGALLSDLGKLQEAELSYRKAIEIKPDFAIAKMNLDFITHNRVPKWHIPMMNDTKRNNAYLKAINSAIKDNEYVLEIGTGSGLLSMMANDAGAHKVVTCEVSQPIAEAAKRIIEINGYKDRIKVINKKSTELIVGKDLDKKADLIISEILSSEFVGEGVQPSLSDANKRLIKDNGKMIPEAGEIKIALLESSPEIEQELFVRKVNGYDLSEFNNIMGTKVGVHYLGRKMTTTFLSEEKVPFYFNFYSKEIRNKKEVIIDLEVCKSGICLGLITWIRLNLYKDIYFENKPDEKGTSGWTNPIYKFNQPLKLSKGQVIKVKATLLRDSVHYEFI